MVHAPRRRRSFRSSLQAVPDRQVVVVPHDAVTLPSNVRARASWAYRDGRGVVAETVRTVISTHPQPRTVGESVRDRGEVVPLFRSRRLACHDRLPRIRGDRDIRRVAVRMGGAVVPVGPCSRTRGTVGDSHELRMSVSYARAGHHDARTVRATASAMWEYQ